MLKISNATSDELRKAGLHDLSQLACQAAIELDNYFLGRGTKIVATTFLAQWIKDRIDEYIPNDPGCASDFGDIVFLHEVMKRTARLTQSVVTVSDLLEEVEKTRLRLEEVAKDPLRASGDEVAALRDFCVKFSSTTRVMREGSPYRMGLAA